MALTDPRFDAIFAIPNGGHRHKAVAAKLKAQGVKAGIPDIMVPVGIDIAERHYNGLFIELKSLDPSARPSTLQRKRMQQLSDLGYMTQCVWGHEAAIELICKYLGYNEYGSVNKY